MTLPFSLLLALKYLKPKRTFLSVVTVFSVTGVTIGVAVLIIVLSVMTGFDAMWREKILDFNAHVNVVVPGSLEGREEEVCRAVEAEEGVTGAAPFLQSLVFLQKWNGRVETPLLRGIDPEREGKVSRIPRMVKEGRFDVSGGRVLIGRHLAATLGVGVGDRVTAYSPATFLSQEEILMPRELEVGGIFETGMWEFDSGYVMASLWDARDFCGAAAQEGVQVASAAPMEAMELARRLDGVAEGARAVSWMEQNEQLFSALQVEKNMMFYLLIFITVVAAFGITNTLITMTVQKTKEIGLLRSLGFSQGAIMRVFFWQGWLEGLAGTGLGIALGLTALRYRNALLRFLNERCGMSLLPQELYHLAEIPAVTLPGDVWTVAVSVLVICTLAAVLPAWRASKADPAGALRYE